MIILITSVSSRSKAHTIVDVIQTSTMLLILFCCNRMNMDLHSEPNYKMSGYLTLCHKSSTAITLLNSEISRIFPTTFANWRVLKTYGTLTVNYQDNNSFDKPNLTRSQNSSRAYLFELIFIISNV